MNSRAWSFILLWLWVAPGPSLARHPLALHPQNPHYFIFRGDPTILITSAEHYGAVLNLDFAYNTYLDTLKRDGLNLTRTFSGAYVEPQGAFNIARNTLAPAPGKFICPWPRSDAMGYANGGRKFDLSQWDEAYFTRLKNFVSAAAKRGIVVEMNLFCPFYDEAQWKLSPQNASNNVNGVGAIARTNVYTLDKNGGLLPVHEAMTRKIVRELNEFDNVYYEICNEPYFGGVTLEWQHYIADVIRDTEFPLAHKHLISQNVANNKARVVDPHPAISIFNFHYATPPDTVAMNYYLDKAIGDNETGFAGTNDFPYRREGWDFILAGGALFNNLDYSFTTDNEDGTFRYPPKQPGGGNPAFREQMRILKDFIHSFDFIRMRPNPEIVQAPLPQGMSARCLSEHGTAYAVYVCLNPQTVSEYSIVWTGKVQPKHTGKYTFYTSSNDGVHLMVNDQPVIENWTDHSTKEDQGDIELKAGTKYEIKLEYYQAGGGATIKLYWSHASQPKEIIPVGHLSTPDGSGRGLLGQYYFGKNFEHLKMTRTDPTINFDWSNKSPFDKLRVAAADETITLNLNLPPGRYEADWLNTKTGESERRHKIRHTGNLLTLVSPPFKEDIALAIRK